MRLPSTFLHCLSRYFAHLGGTEKVIKPEIRLPPLTPQNAILGMVEDESHETDDIKLISHILLTFKQSLYSRRDALTPPNFFYVRERLKQVQKIEYKQERIKPLE